MVAHINTFSFNGIETIPVDVQCQISSGMVNFSVVGLPDKSVAESRERIRACFSSLGLSFPAKRVVVNLSPADVFKEGSHYDLPIILCLLTQMNLLPQSEIIKYYALGEISLDAGVIGVSGVLPSAISALGENKGLICPKENAEEACWAGEDLDILAVKTITELLNHFKGMQIIGRPNFKPNLEESNNIKYPDFADIRGQETAKRAAEIAASGGHNLLMSGPPGSGKSMIASRLAGILPELEPKEILETSMIHSIAGNIKGGNLVTKRPFRSPHHNCSMPAMIGGGTRAKPGEVSLSHNGVLFLDEFPEFPRQVLDSLRQPLEAREVSISRVNSHITYPAKFQLIGAMNPCKCGYLDDAAKACSRAPKCANEYQAKISGPLLDRFDIYIEVSQQNAHQAFNLTNGEGSKTIKSRVLKCREFQRNRYKETDYKTNSDLQGNDIEKFCITTDEAKNILQKGAEALNLSMRGYTRVLRTARTIADMEENEIIEKPHIAEALSFRQRNY
ncbi:MAG: YifB family Mg chelatase-like AAA ATPase [Rickettsiales bacterium]|nr:YifB family Mg chelatase-like AAA ATPase [Rickettsiales bacterium]